MTLLQQVRKDDDLEMGQRGDVVFRDADDEKVYLHVVSGRAREVQTRVPGSKIGCHIC
jgi:hypothetical protein